MQNDKTTQWFERHNLTPPSHVPHGKQAEIDANLTPLKARSWRLEGNRLIAETEMGKVVNYIDPGVIMTGVDKDNMPIFKRI